MIRGMKKRTGPRTGTKKVSSSSRSARKPRGRSFVKERPGSRWKLVPTRSARRGKAADAAARDFPKRTAGVKLVASLHSRKGRDERQLFLVEGEKSFLEALASDYVLHAAFGTHAFVDRHPDVLETCGERLRIVDENELTSMGTLATGNGVIGVFRQKEHPRFSVGDELVIALSDVNDPGNLGTIIRIADWYGISKIVASEHTVDAYNPKVISASKGSFTRVSVHAADLDQFLSEHPDVPVFAADMRGDDVHAASFPTRGVLLLGSESHGIPEDLERYITARVTIPRYGKAESLNVAVACAVILDNWKR